MSALTRTIKVLSLSCLLLSIQTALAQTNTDHSKALFLHATEQLWQNSFEFEGKSTYLLKSDNTQQSVLSATQPQDKEDYFSAILSSAFKVIGSILETTYNLAGNSQMYIKGGVDRKKEKMGIHIDLSSQSHNLDTKITLPFLYDYRNHTYIFGFNEINPFLMDKTTISPQEYQNKYIRIDVGEEINTIKKIANIQDFQQYFIQQNNTLLSALPDRFFQEVTLSSEDKAQSGVKKIRMMMTVTEMYVLLDMMMPESLSEETTKLNFEEQLEKKKTELAGIFGGLSEEKQDNEQNKAFEDYFNTPIQMDYLLNSKNQFIKITSNSTTSMSLFNHILNIPNTAPDLISSAEYLIKYTNRPNLGFEPKASQIIDLPKNEQQKAEIDDSTDDEQETDETLVLEEAVDAQSTIEIKDEDAAASVTQE
ncbi:hypothetical protein [Neisseria sp. Ec49-e6-T10]|uniref:hypothetical protein n=1 Tax=Neisseria sp. Ec49-e6-T10 TaxID=3140744 RepID=UPI003EBF0172